MDNTKLELASIEATVAKAHEAEQRELTDLELVLVGGGCGDTILA